MFPVLFTVGPLRVESYYVIWGVALCAMVLLTRRRAVAAYGISFNDATDVLLWMIFGVFIGATLGGYLDNWTRYAASPIKLLYFWESGLSSGPGFIGGGVAGLCILRRRGLPVNAFAEAASIPCALLLFVGRWGCFLNGCCLGIPTDSAWGVAFPAMRSAVYPSQLFESAAAGLIGILLWAVERLYQRTPEQAARGAVLWPIFLILYGMYRIAFDFLRLGDRIFGFRVGQYTGAIAFVVGMFWLVHSIRRIRGDWHGG